ncbi:unnamed protein product, partial [Ectocarpus sp. 12 AP-2014]
AAAAKVCCSGRCRGPDGGGSTCSSGGSQHCPPAPSPAVQQRGGAAREGRSDAPPAQLPGAGVRRERDRADGGTGLRRDQDSFWSPEEDPESH